MKKIMLLLAVAGLIFVSCGGTKTEQAIEVIEETCALTPEQEMMFANWENWDALDLEQREALVDEMKSFIDACKAKCEKKCEGKEEGEKEICPEKEAKCAEFKAKWEAFEELELDVKKELLDMKLQHMAKKCCKSEKDKCCKKDKEDCTKE
jgi:TRAP-type C4-dicarboxylate transport system substrate-binding protein